MENEIVSGDNRIKLRTGLKVCAWAPIINIIAAVLLMAGRVYAANPFSVLSTYITLLIIADILFLVAGVMNVVGLDMCAKSFVTDRIKNAFNYMKIFAAVAIALSVASFLVGFFGSDSVQNENISNVIAIMAVINGIVAFFVNRAMVGRIGEETTLAGMTMAKKSYTIILGSILAYIIVLAIAIRSQSDALVFFLLIALIALLVGCIMLVVAWFQAAYDKADEIEVIQ